MKALTCLVAVAALFFSCGALAQIQLTGENLLVSPPAGFKVASQSTADNTVTQEWVPQSQTADNWTDKVTIQVFHGKRDTDGAAYLRAFGQGWLAACPGSQANAIPSSGVNGYQAALLFLRCDNNPKTGKPENILIKAIAGQDNFYVIQKTFRLMPNEGQIDEAATFLGRVSVCDSRAPEHPCPALAPVPPKPSAP